MPGNSSTSSLVVNGRSHTGLIVIGVSLLFNSVALYWIPDRLEHWHYFLQRLFYFPIILAGLNLGWPGGGAVAILSSAVYLMRHDDLDRFDAVDHYLEAAMFCLVGMLTGVLSERERKQRESLRTTAQRLEEVYRELQNNVEHLKRAARMSALGQLSAALAHEIRNPLASIEGAAYVAKAEPDGARRSEFLEIIGKETRRLNDLVTHFLEFARPRAPQLAATDPRALAESVLTLVGHVAAEHGVRLHNAIPENAAAIRCDNEQMKQVFLNLVLNAIQAMPGGGDLTISTEKVGDFVMLRVKDSGPGILQQYTDEIFDPFFTTKQHGSGLGLPIAYQIVQQHGGELILESNSSAGCCFTIRMPLLRDEPVHQGSKA